MSAVGCAVKCGRIAGGRGKLPFLLRSCVSPYLHDRLSALFRPRWGARGEVRKVLM